MWLCSVIFLSSTLVPSQGSNSRNRKADSWQLLKGHVWFVEKGGEEKSGMERKREERNVKK